MALRIHVVSNSHIDPVWLWDKYEGIDEVLNTFRSACDRLDETPNLTFAASSMQFYEWVLHYDRPLFDRIRRFVESNRWEMVGGWWVEADTNLPLAESFIRHARISKQFVRDHFDRDIEVAYLPDTFGHPATLPKLLADEGFKYMLFCRPDANEKPDLPANLFHWECEGRSVLGYRLKHHYAQWGDDDRVNRILSDEEFAANPVNCHLFGLGDHGGGPTIHEVNLYKKAIAANKTNDIGFSTLGAFFKDAVEHTPSIPTYSGDLHMHAIGCYSVVRKLKEGVRSAERGLAFAERALDMDKQPADQLTPQWKTTLFNQFHDILPGSCSPDAARQACDELGGVSADWRDISYSALKNVGLSRPVVVKEGEFRIFNTLPHDITRPLAIESFMYFKPDASFRDQDGREITIQQVAPSVRCANRRWEFIDMIPARGFKSYHFDSATPAKHDHSKGCEFAPGDSISAGNTSINAAGNIAAESGELLSNPMRFLVLDDPTDTWGHGVRSYDDVMGAFEIKSTATAAGSVLSQMYQTLCWGDSRIDVVYTIYNELPGIYLDVTVGWREWRKILKLEIAPDVGGLRSFLMQGPGGAINRRTDGAEYPLHSWLCLAGTKRDFAVLQDGAFACDSEQSRLRLTLVRSSIYGFHDPNKLNPHDPQHQTDQGEHHFRLCLLPGSNLTPDVLDQAAAAFLEPCLVIREGKR